MDYSFFLREALALADRYVKVAERNVAVTEARRKAERDDWVDPVKEAQASGKRVRLELGRRP